MDLYTKRGLLKFTRYLIHLFRIITVFERKILCTSRDMRYRKYMAKIVAKIHKTTDQSQERINLYTIIDKIGLKHEVY